MVGKLFQSELYAMFSAMSAAILILSASGPETTQQSVTTARPALQTYRDPITDREMVAVIVESGGNAIAIGCATQSRSVRVQFFSEAYLGRNAPSVIYWKGNRISATNYERELTYRFDSDPPQTSKWYYEDGKSAWREGLTFTIGFVRRMMTAQRLVVRAHSSTGERVDAQFDTSGADEALRALAGRCGNEAFDAAVLGRQQP